MSNPEYRANERDSIRHNADELARAIGTQPDATMTEVLQARLTAMSIDAALTLAETIDADLEHRSRPRADTGPR